MAEGFILSPEAVREVSAYQEAPPQLDLPAAMAAWGLARRDKVAKVETATTSVLAFKCPDPIRFLRARAEPLNSLTKSPRGPRRSTSGKCRPEKAKKGPFHHEK
jgi:hypothetical protein